MRVVLALMMLLGALAVLMTAAAPASAWTDAASTPPCHEATTPHDGAGTHSPASDEAMAPMDCCIASVAAPALPAPERARVMAPRPAVVDAPTVLPRGEQPAPEPHPPRPSVS